MPMQTTAAEEKKFLTQRENASAYLEKHAVPQVLQQILTSVLHSRPDDPRRFIIKKLEDARNAKSRSQSMLVFTRENLVALFRIFDVTGKGYISLDQYKSAMVDIGAINFNQTPNGHERDRISADDFVDNAFASLLKPPKTPAASM